MTGWKRATEEVTAAMNRRENQTKPTNCPRGIFWKITGSDKKPRLKAPPLAMIIVSVTPKKATAIGMAMVLPRMTSANSLVAAVLSPFRRMSSSFRR